MPPISGARFVLHGETRTLGVMARHSDYIGSERAARLARAKAPEYEAKLKEALVVARDVAAGGSETVLGLLESATVLGLSEEIPMKCSFLVLQGGRTLGYMWHLMDETSVTDLGRQVLTQAQDVAKDLGKHDA